MKKITYSLEVKQKRGDDIVTISYGGWKKIRYKYDKRKRVFKATLIGFDKNNSVVEYTDVVGVVKRKN